MRSRNASNLGGGQHIHTAMGTYIQVKIYCNIYLYMPVIPECTPVILNIIFLLFTFNGIS